MPWWSTGPWTGPPNTSSASSSVPLVLPLSSRTGMLGMALLRLLLLRLGLLHALPHHHDSPARAGAGAAKEDEILLGHHPHDHEVEHGAPHVAHPPGQLVARPHARGIRGGADRAGRPVEHRSVGGVAAGPAVALHAALEPLALRHAHHVHVLAGREHLRGEDLSGLVGGEVLRLLEADLAHDAHGPLDTRLLVHPRHRLAHVLSARLEAELERVVAVGGLAADAHDGTWAELHHGHGDEVA